MINSMRRGLAGIGMLAALLAATHTQAAERGVTDTEIRLGSSQVLSGPLGPQTVQYGEGAQLLFDEINASGGVNGRKITITRLDDGFEVDKAVANAKKLISDDKVFLLFNNTGTAQTGAILPILAETKTILFGPVTGATGFRSKVNPYLFHVRASYADEAEKIMSQISLIGLKRVAMVYQDDPFGKTLLAEIEKAAAKEKIELVAKVAVDSKKDAFADEARAVNAAKPQAVILGGAGTTVPKVIGAVQDSGIQPTFYGFSVASVGAINGILKERARGVVLAQIMPSLRNSAVSVVREYQALLKKRSPDAQPSAAQFEGYVHARLLVEGLKRAGRDLTTQSLIQAFESLGEVTWGSFRARYSPATHNGTSFVELAIIDANGKLLY